MIGITAKNHILPLLVILKGKKLPKDVTHLQSNDLIISMMDNAWMTTEYMLNWIDIVWKPYSCHFGEHYSYLTSFGYTSKEMSWMRFLNVAQMLSLFLVTSLSSASLVMFIWINHSKTMLESIGNNLWKPRRMRVFFLISYYKLFLRLPQTKEIRRDQMDYWKSKGGGAWWWCFPESNS